MVNWKNGWIVLGIVAIASCKTKAPATTESKKTKPAATRVVTAAGLEQAILDEVNKYRKSKGLPPLKSSSVIATEAAMHSQAMASKQVAFGHDGFESRIKRISSRIDGVKASAENVAQGKLTAAELVRGWSNSAPHRKNMEGNYTLTGIGVSRSSNGVFYYTQLFIRN
ncbi:MAG TPA: CAP domain-containing protein [Flavihumibacter sp.]